jgi:hypothetical protein
VTSTTMSRERRYGVRSVGAEGLVLDNVGQVKNGAIGYQDRGGRVIAETEREKEEKLEKARAAAWAWYQHGKGGKDSLSRSRTLSTGESKLFVRPNEVGHKSSRFKIEAVKSTWRHAVAAPEDSKCHRPNTSGLGWDLSNFSFSRTSSLYDDYELGHMSKCIETAVNGRGSTSASSGFTPLRPGLYILNEAEGLTVGLPPCTSRPETSDRFASKVVTVRDKLQETSSNSKLIKNRTFRLQFPRYICSSLNGVVPHEDMAHINMVKSNSEKTRSTFSSDGSGWSLRKSSRVHSIQKVCSPSSKGVSRTNTVSSIDPTTPLKAP